MDEGLDGVMVKRVLMIAFHYPPLRGSSGIQRTLKFSQYLPDSDWHPVVLSAHPRAYPNTGNDQMGEISTTVRARREVHRAFASDTSTYLSPASERDCYMKCWAIHARSSWSRPGYNQRLEERV
jgi:hypothetical protein